MKIVYSAVDMERTEGDSQPDQRKDKGAESETNESTEEQLGTDKNAKLSTKESVGSEKDAQGRNLSTSDGRKFKHRGYKS